MLRIREKYKQRKMEIQKGENNSMSICKVGITDLENMGRKLIRELFMLQKKKQSADSAKEGKLNKPGK